LQSKPSIEIRRPTVMLPPALLDAGRHVVDRIAALESPTLSSSGATAAA